MELLQCPICGKKGLTQADGTKKIGDKLVVCANEFYTHWHIGYQHFLTRTELSEMLEPKEPVMNGVFGEMVLN